MDAAELVLFSDAIFDSVGDVPFAGGIAVSGNKIRHVGSREAVEKYIGPNTVVRDFGDQLIMPGICDGHAHLDGTANKQYAEVAGGLDKCKSEEECVRAVKAFAENHPGLKRINGISWVLTNWGPNPKKPTKASLDRAFPDIPVYLLGADGHSNWLNSKAIEECNLEEIVRKNPDVPELAPRDENGEFTGFLAERICHIVNAFAEKYTREQKTEYQSKIIRELNAQGITGFTDVTPMPSAALADYYWLLKSLENSGKLTLRCYIWAGLGPDRESGSAEDAERVRLHEAFMNSDKLRIAGIKALIDGIPFSHTSAMLEPYDDNPNVRGEFLQPAEVYHRWITAVNKLGYAVKLHCCGDAAVRLALDSFELSNAVNDNRKLRNSVEHMDIVSNADIPRFKKLRVIASIQPAHVIMTKGIYDVRIGERSKQTWNYRRLINSGAVLSIGTDSPVVDFNPFQTIYFAVTRRDLDGIQYSPNTADQALTLPEALKGYTINSAYASNMEHKVGTLEAGKYADIIVLDRNLFKVSSEELKDSRVVCTIFDGRVVYEGQ
jgi:predicted amidohydrolase YtcJ